MNLDMGQDRMSNLPEELLINVISCLPTTKDAIRTCVLSRRWKYLWTYIPSYNFEYDHESLFDGVFSSSKKSYVDSLNRLFSLRDPGSCITKFRICTPIEIDNAKIGEWINFLVARNVQELEAKFLSDIACPVPTSLLTCKTLVVLKLFCGIYLITMPNTIFMPNLKTLHLDLLKYCNESVSALFSGCPILEELYLTKDLPWDFNVSQLNISVHSLKRLSIRCSHDCSFLEGYEIIVVAPLLKSIELYDTRSISLNTMPSLVEAHIDIKTLEDTDQLWVLLSDISNIKRLSIPARTIGYFRLGQDRPSPQFRNMEHLTIGRDDDYDSGWKWKFLPALLDRMPKLNDLVFKEGLCEANNIQFRRRRQTAMPLCLHSHLKTIKFYKFEGGITELDVVKYFLENAKVLVSITIHYDAYYKHHIDDGLNRIRCELKNARVLEKVTTIQDCS